MTIDNIHGEMFGRAIVGMCRRKPGNCWYRRKIMQQVEWLTMGEMEIIRIIDGVIFQSLNNFWTSDQPTEHNLLGIGNSVFVFNFCIRISF